MYRLSTMAAVATAAIASPAMAQERRLDEEIVVTGQRDGYSVDVVQVGAFRNRGVLDTPTTINVVPRSLLDDQGAQGLDDALRNTPGVTQQTTSPFNTNTFVARGIAVDAQTNYRLNGGLPIINFAPMPIENKERVELLKGASALYYGFANPSGIINLVTKRAGAQDVTAAYGIVDAQGGFGGGVDIGRRFGSDGQVGVRINAFGAKTESTTDGVSGNRQMVSGAFDWQARERLSFRVDAEYYRREGEEPGGVSLPAAVRGTITLPNIPSPSNRYAPAGAPFKTEGLNLTARADYALAGTWSARIEGGISSAHRDRLIVALGSVNLATGAGRLTLTRTPDQFWQNRYVRAEIGGKLETGQLQHALLLGVSRTRQYRRDQPQTRYAPIAQNLYDPVTIDLSSLVPASRTVLGGNTVTDSGAYVMDVISLGSRFDLIGGARAVEYRTRTASQDYTLRTVTPTVAGILHLTSASSLYSSYIQGLESAGLAPDGTTNAGETLPAARSRQWEAGVRMKLLGAMASLSWFNIDRALSYANADNLFVVDGRAVHRGVEGSLLGALGHGFEVALSGQYLNAKQRETGSATLNGKRVVNTPEWSGSAFVQYRLPAIDRLAINAGAYYIGSRYADAANLAVLPGFVTYSLGGSYRFTLKSGTSLTFRLNGDNLTNKRYWATGGNTLNVGASRTVRASLTIDLPSQPQQVRSRS